MKSLLVSFVLIFSLPLAASAEKEGGGGSYKRLLARADFKALTPPKTSRHLLEKDITKIFLMYSNIFLSRLKERVSQGQTQFEDHVGSTATVTPADLEKMAQLIRYLEIHKDSKLVVVSHLNSMDTGEEMTAINIPEEQKIIFSSNGVNEVYDILNYEMFANIWSSFVGHELLSLLGIENGKSYAVSANFVRFGYDHPLSFNCESYKPKLKLHVTVENNVSTITPINFTWPTSTEDMEPRSFRLGEEGLCLGGPWHCDHFLNYNWIAQPDKQAATEITIWEILSKEPRLIMHYNKFVEGNLETFTIPAGLVFYCKQN